MAQPRDRNCAIYIVNDQKNEVLLHALLYCNSYSNGSTNHRVVTHAEEAHHLNVSRN